MSRWLVLPALLLILITQLSFSIGTQYVATAYSLRGRTASGEQTRAGTVAADVRLHPLGSKISIRAGQYSGIYTVLDRGSKIRGKRIDIYISDKREARRFGKRKVWVQKI